MLALPSPPEGPKEKNRLRRPFLNSSQHVLTSSSIYSSSSPPPPAGIFLNVPPNAAMRKRGKSKVECCCSFSKRGYFSPCVAAGGKGERGGSDGDVSIPGKEILWIPGRSREFSPELWAGKKIYGNYVSAASAAAVRFNGLPVCIVVLHSSGIKHPRSVCGGISHPQTISNSRRDTTNMEWNSPKLDITYSFTY